MEQERYEDAFGICLSTRVPTSLFFSYNSFHYIIVLLFSIQSTILCAMCLGLGGEPRLLGRASEIETFVANGHDEGMIEVEVVNTNPGESNPIIVRTIRRGGSPKSSFTWNGNAISPKAVRETCLNQFNITVDNMCTFLPQDRVGSFSGFDSKQLLLETEKSLSASRALYHTHMELINDQEEMKGGVNRKANLEEQYERLQTESKRLERAKDLMEERNLAVAQADLLRKKKLWLEFDHIMAQVEEKKAVKAEMKTKLRQMNQELAPLQAAFEEATQREQQLRVESDKHDKDRRQHQREMETQSKKYEAHDDKIESIIQELVALDANREVKQKKVDDFRVKVEEFRESLSQYPPVETLQEEVQQAKKEQQATLPKYDAAKKEVAALVQESREAEDEAKRADTKLKKMQDEKARRRERIFRQEPNLQKVSNWLNENRSKFRKEVVGPIMCEITSRSQETAAYLEQHVANATLKSFIVQCKEDYELLYRSVRERLGIPINISLIDRITPIQRMYSDQKYDTLKREHGVLGYLDETFTAPDVVVQALRNSSSIEKVLVGGKSTQKSVDDKGLLEYLAQPEDGTNQLKASCIFTTGDGHMAQKYTSGVSRYSQKKTMKVDYVKPAKWLAPGVSDEAKDQAKELFETLNKKFHEIRPQLEQAEANLAEIQRSAQQLREEAKTAREKLKNLERQRLKLSNAERKLKEAEDDLSVDDQEEKNRLTQNLNRRIHHSMQALEAHGESHKKMMRAAVQYAGARLNTEVAQALTKRSE